MDNEHIKLRLKAAMVFKKKIEWLIYFQQVRIKVIDFSTQTEDDILKMRDSQGNYVAWLYDSPTTSWPDILIPDSHVHITFITNGIGVDSGFHMEYMCDTSSGKTCTCYKMSKVSFTLLIRE